MNRPIRPSSKYRIREPKAMDFAPLRFDARQVALMVRVAMFYDPLSLMASVSLGRRELLAMAEGKKSPPKAVLNYFRLTADGAEYVWEPELEGKSNPCWGPIPTTARPLVIQNGAAIHHSVRTVESAFAGL